MTPHHKLPFGAVWALDSEYLALPGERPIPVCVVARELRSGREIRLWQDELWACGAPPYDIGPDSVVCAHYSSAEWGCHLALGWPLPVNIIDTFAEFRVQTNGLPTPSGAGLLGALSYVGLESMSVVEKEGMRQLIMRGGPWTEAEKQSILDYCATDVDGVARLLPALLPHMSLGHALLRGRYMCAAAAIEHRGIPIDADLLGRLQRRWPQIKARLIDAVNPAYGVYERGSFSQKLFGAWLAKLGIAWPRLESGKLALDDDTWRAMVQGRPELQLLYELRSTLARLRLTSLEVGSDGRNRTMLSAFRASTGRNQPGSSKFVFGPARWIRGLIKPGPGMAVAYVDWSQQELGIAAALSGDKDMKEAYECGDPYLRFAQQAGAAPPDATRETHEAVREQFKACSLGVNYSMGEQSLAMMAGITVREAHALLELHHQTYPTYWAWSDAAVNYAMLGSRIHTTFGWVWRIGPDSNPRAIRNFPMQANGAEMLRLACILCLERGLPACAPVHDALMFEAPLEDIDRVVAEVQRAMADASAIVLKGFRLRSDVKIVRYPDRFMDKRGADMWAKVSGLLAEIEADGADPDLSTAAAQPARG